MSKIRGVFPLFLATTFGILNESLTRTYGGIGIAIFGPAFKEQEQEKKELDPGSLHETRPAGSEDAQVLEKAEVDAMGVGATGRLPQHVANKSPWSSLQFWKQDKAEMHEVAEQESKGTSRRPPNEASSV